MASFKDPRNLPPLRPIGEAPIKRGKRFGKCLLFDEIYGWVIGEWDGDDWFDHNTGAGLEPTIYIGPLP